MKIFQKTKKELLYNIRYNIAFLVLDIIFIIFVTLSWFVANEKMTVGGLETFTYNIGLPIYLDVVFNEQESQPGYTSSKISFDKMFIPGDVMNFSVYIDIGALELNSIDIIATDVPSWLLYYENSASLCYASMVDSGQEGEILVEKDEFTECEAQVLDIARVAGEVRDEIKFNISVPEGATGLCLDFKLYYNDDETNQNAYMNETIELGFKSHISN